MRRIFVAFLLGVASGTVFSSLFVHPHGPVRSIQRIRSGSPSRFESIKTSISLQLMFPALGQRTCSNGHTTGAASELTVSLCDNPQSRGESMSPNIPGVLVNGLAARRGTERMRLGSVSPSAGASGGR
jgi:hypothetical protein